MNKVVEIWDIGIFNSEKYNYKRFQPWISNNIMIMSAPMWV